MNEDQTQNAEFRKDSAGSEANPETGKETSPETKAGMNESTAAGEQNAGQEEAEAKAAAEPEKTEDAGKDTSAESGTGTAGQEPRDEKKSSGFFQRRDKKKDKKDEEIADLKDKLLRNMAEFDNYRKRTEKEKDQMFDVGARAMLEKFLPTIDGFERGLGTLTEEQKSEPFAAGMEKVYRQMLKSLTDAGLTVIEAEGKAFDPNFHNAVMHEEDSEKGENLVSQELQKGYMYHDVVIRHSMVKVVN